MKAISVVVADDHAIVREGMCVLLRREPDIDVVADVADGEEAWRRIATLSPDVAVADVDMPRMTGIEVARKVRDAGLRTALVIVSIHKQKEFVRAAFDAGASGYVAKESTSAELIDAVRAASKGEVYLSRAIGKAVVAALRAPERDPSSELTPRERDVVRLCARGLSGKETGAALGISPGTVNWYRATIMEKLGLEGLPALVKYAIKHQLATLDD